MPATTYETLEGEILGETRGGVERDYLPDPLGSTAALIDSSQAKTDTFAYWPYGEERSHTGTSVTPFRFAGTLGYYRDDVGRTYVRARHLLTKNARWLTVDPLWPDESAYGYAAKSPANWSDPAGKKCPPKPCSQWYKDNWKTFRKGCQLICEQLVCSDLPPIAKQACQRWCKSECRKAGPDKPPKWGNCDQYPTTGGSGTTCADCCEAN